jgi:MFS family permease
LSQTQPIVEVAGGRHSLGRNVIALSLVSLLTDVSSELIYPLLPIFLSTTLGASASFIGTIEGAAESVASLLKLGSGWWSDRTRHRKPLVVLGYVLATIARPLVAIAQSASHVLAIRLTDRIGKGIRTAPRDALISESVDPSIRGKAFGVHRSADHLGAVLGPLLAFLLLGMGGLPIRQVFWIAAIPGVLAVIVLVVGVKEIPRSAPAKAAPDLSLPLDTSFWKFLAVVLLFTLGNSTDAFLLLRATQLGVPIALIPILWAMLHFVKAASSGPGGAMSDRVGRKPMIVAGWLLYAAVYFGFGVANASWQIWVLFAIYGVFFGLTEGVEKALVSDLVPPARRGTAFGWYHLTIGLAALPASLLFGIIWDRAGAMSAFMVGGALALIASLAMTVLVRPAAMRHQEN